MNLEDLVKVICAVFACTGLLPGTFTKTALPVRVTPQTSSTRTIHVNLNVSIDFPNSKNNHLVQITVHNDSSNSINSSVPILDSDDDTVNVNVSNPIKPLVPKTAVENDLSWVQQHPNWVYMVEPNNAPCGESISTDRIIGGTTAALGQHPWIARIGRYKFYNGFGCTRPSSGHTNCNSVYVYCPEEGKVKGNVDWFCSGVAINKLYILTAAHCSYDKNLRLIRLGEYDAQTNVDCNLDGCAAPVQDFVPHTIIRHREHVLKEVISPHDIALIRLNSEINFNGWVAPICLPYFNDPKLFLGNAETIGWGLTIPMVPSYSAVLQTVHVPIMSEEQCRAEEYKSLAVGTFCAGGVKDEDSCNGDSGGPLLKVNDHDGFPKYYAIGIVSFGPALCGNGRLGAYTNISSHMHWILSNINF